MAMERDRAKTSKPAWNRKAALRVGRGRQLQLDTPLDGCTDGILATYLKAGWSDP